MYTFKEIVCFENKDLIEAMKQYASERIAQKRGVNVDVKFSKADKLKKINDAYVKEVVKSAGVEAKFSAVKSDTDRRRFSQIPNVGFYAREIRDILVDAILPIVMDASTLTYFAQTDFADLGGTISYHLKNNALYTVSKASYKTRRANIQKVSDTTVTLAGENHEITVATDFFDIMCGNSNIAEDVMKAAISMQTQMYVEAYTSLNGAMAQANIPQQLRATQFSDAAFLQLVNRVKAYNHGARVAVVGTNVALQSVLPGVATGARYFTDSDFVKLGHLEKYKGVDVLPLEQVIDIANQSTYGLALDDNKLYIIPLDEKLVKIGIFGGTISHQDNPYDNANKLVTSTMEKAWETAVITNATAGVIELS